MPQGSGDMKLRPYQQEAISAITNGLLRGGAGQLHAACGSGKSLIALRAAERLVPGDGLIVVLTPSIALIGQTLSTWLDHSVAPFTALALCSDETVHDTALRAQDLTVPVTTDPTEVAAWITEEGRRLLLCTYASASTALAPALHAAGKTADLLILDEAHHLAGPADAPTRRLASRTLLPAHRRLYMTATPREGTSRSDAALLSMDDTDVFGPVLYEYPFSRAIAEGYLDDYRLLVVGVTDHQARQLLADASYRYVDSIGAPSLETIVAQAALAKARVKYGIRRTITFHHTVQGAADFALTLPATVQRLPADQRPHGPLDARHVHGDMGLEVRRRSLRYLSHPPEDGWAVVSNARCLGEGVDVPAVDSVLFSEPKRSAVDIAQAVGRALRRHPESTGTATIIVPIVVPDQNGEIGDLDPQEYATLWRVIRALRAHDEPLGAELDARRFHPGTGHGNRLEKITVELPPGTSESILEQLTVLLVRQTTSAWWEGYAAAVDYHSAHGNLLVPARYVDQQGRRLGLFVANQRKHYKQGWVSADRIAALEKLGMVWSARTAHLEEFAERCRAFHAEHGHLWIPQDYVAEPGSYQLGSKTHTMRRAYKAGRLPADFVAELEGMGMIWDTTRSRNAEFIARCRAYHSEYGNLRIRKDYVTPDGYPLGRAVHSRRTRHAAGRLPPVQAAVLEELGGLTPMRRRRTELISSAPERSVAC